MRNERKHHGGAGTLRDVLQVFGSRAAALLLALGAQVLLARTLGPEGRGAYDAALLWGTLAIMLLNPALDTSSLYFVSSGTMRIADGVTAAARVLALILVATVSITALLLVVPIPALTGYLGKAPGLLLLLGGVTGVSTLAMQTSLGMSTAGQKYGAYSSGQLAHRTIQFLVVFLLVTVLHTGPTGGILAIIAADILIVSMIVVLLLREPSSATARPTRENIRALLAYGRRFYFGKLGGQFNFRLGPLVLAISASASDLGLYGQASAIAIQYMSLPEAIYTVLLPRMSSSTATAARQTAQTARLMVALGVVTMAASLFAAQPLFRFLFSDTFLPAVPLFQILLAAFIIRALGKVHEPYLLAINRPGLVSLAVAIGLGFNAILLALLYTRFGLIGVAWALFGNYALSTVVLIGAFGQVSRIGLRHSLQWQREDTAVIYSVWSALVGSLRR